MVRPATRTADPYRDDDVVDRRAPRFNQATVGVGATIAVITGWWPILLALAIQLGIGLRLGRRYCLPCVAYFELVQPRLGEGPVEDARPPRFATQVGLVVLSAASLAYLAGLTLVGAALAEPRARPLRARGLAQALRPSRGTPGPFAGYGEPLVGRSP